MKHTAISIVFGIGLVLSVEAVFIGQGLSAQSAAGLLSDEPRFNAPFHARATLTVMYRFDNGERMRRSGISNHFRDSYGRVRIEYAVATESGDVRAVVLLMPNPYAPTERVFLIDHVEKLIERVDFATIQRFFNASTVFALPTGLKPGLRGPSRASWFLVFPAENVHTPANSGSGEHLGRRVIAGLEVTGTRFSANLSGAVDERWESADLGLVVSARHLDSRAEIEYRLNDVRRDEPDPSLFVMPVSYQYNHTPTLVWDSPEAELRRLERR